MVCLASVMVALAMGAPELPPASEPAPPVESAPPPSGDGPPLQRPSTLPPPSAAPPPTAVDTPPVTTPPVTTPPPAEPPPQPIATQPIAPAPVPRIESGGTEIPVTTDPFDDTPARPLPIPPAFRRPGAWLGTGGGLLVLGAILRFTFPSVTRIENRCESSGECRTHSWTNGGVAMMIALLPIDGMTMVAFGFAGRSFGLRDARRAGTPSRRVPMLGAGVPLVVAGAALTFAGILAPLLREQPDEFSYAIAAIRQAGIVAGSAGAFLVGYGAAQPRTGYAARARPDSRSRRASAAAASGSR
jgi:hypothetical protein